MIYVIVGPTGSGKTSLACQVAAKFDLPIINADAFQIYQDMNIGTAKISKSNPLYKRHFLIDIVNPNQTYSVKQYRDDFDNIIFDLLKNNKNVLICGGTGLYIRAALYDYSFPEEKTFDESVFDNLTNEELYEKLLTVDPESAKTIHMNNRKRVIRALIFSEQNQVNKSENISSQNHKMRFGEVKILFLNPNREQLYETINNRVDEMFDNGLVDEVKSLLLKYKLSLTASQAIGYKEVIEYLNGQCNLEECKELIKKRSRNYAKRQVTFFRHQFETIEYNNKDTLLLDLVKELEKY